MAAEALKVYRAAQYANYKSQAIIWFTKLGMCNVCNILMPELWLRAQSDHDRHLTTYREPSLTPSTVTKGAPA